MSTVERPLNYAKASENVEVGICAPIKGIEKTIKSNRISVQKLFFLPNHFGLLELTGERDSSHGFFCTLRGAFTFAMQGRMTCVKDVDRRTTMILYSAINTQCFKMST